MFLMFMLSIAAIGFFCWLLFTIAVFALPFFAGVSAASWAYHTGAGWLGAILVGIVAAALTLGFGQVLLAIVRPLWAKLAIATVFVAPAVIAGYHAVHGIVKHTMPSEAWQIVFSTICANASRWDCTLEPTQEEGRFAVRLGLRMIKGLSNANAARLVAVRAGGAFTSIDDLWHRAGVPVVALTQIAEADGFHPCFRLVRREALWALKGLRDEPLPLFAAASAREARTVHELAEPDVALRPLAAGGEVVEDYRHSGLSLRDHPVTFLRTDLRRRRIVTCREAMEARDGRWVEAAGLVLVRQRPGSAKGVMFITLEDESGIANLVVWPKVFEANRRTILSAGMIAVRGRVQREGEVVHLVAQRLTDLSAELASVGERGGAFPLPHGRGDEFHHGSPAPDPRSEPPKGLGTRDIYIRDLHLDTIKVKTRDFR